MNAKAKNIVNARFREFGERIDDLRTDLGEAALRHEQAEAQCAAMQLELDRANAKIEQQRVALKQQKKGTADLEPLVVASKSAGSKSKRGIDMVEDPEDTLDNLERSCAVPE